MQKVTKAFKHIYEHLMTEFDWIFKSDDDTYAILENMRFLLSHYNSSKPGYLGYHFNRHVHNGYMSGGAGYVLSKAAFRTLIEEGINKDSCNFSPTNLDPEASEDINIGRCLNKTGIPVLSSLDIFGRETYHPYPVQQYLTGSLPGYLYEWAMTKPETVSINSLEVQVASFCSNCSGIWAPAKIYADLLLIAQTYKFLFVFHISLKKVIYMMMFHAQAHAHQQ